MKVISIMCCLLFSILTQTSFVFAKNDKETGIKQMNRILDLRGQWNFSIGDREEWKEENFNDDQWENIFVPSPWEDEGYPGYDGYAWYRKKFVLSKDNKNKNLYLRLGLIDDTDEVYVNGHFVGFSGTFPPDYVTAYYTERLYRLPTEILKYDQENTIAIRVYDSQGWGGIVQGQVGIYEVTYKIPIEIVLEGLWKFSPGDNLKWKNSEYDDSDWKEVMVPAIWETQGYKDYDGYAWYRKRIVVPAKYRDERLLLLLGKIDDLDETYINGHLVGETGDMNAHYIHTGGEWQEFRAYSIDQSYIDYDAENVIAVRVYDGQIQGGIYEGPIGIVTRENYRKWRKKEKWDKGVFEFLFNKE